MLAELFTSTISSWNKLCRLASIILIMLSKQVTTIKIVNELMWNMKILQIKINLTLLVIKAISDSHE